MALAEPVSDVGSWSLRNASISLADPIVMGILNVTPDSFSDGGSHVDPADAVPSGLRMVDQGASIIDVGGESTRPGASLVSLDEELRRVVPVVEQLSARGVLVSVDTTKPQIVREAVEAGAVAVNDISGMGDPAMRDVSADTGIGVVLMHMQGTPRTMQRDPQYDDVVADVKSFLVDQAAAAMLSGVRRDSIVIDPGIGFGKTHRHNLELLAHLDSFCATSFPVLVGTSRKGFLGKILEPVRGQTSPDERDGATAATIALAVAAGVKLLRVHNVALAVEVAATAKAIVPNDDAEETNRT